jgi:hypothetical protein
VRCLPPLFEAIGPELENKVDTRKLGNLYMKMVELGRGHSPSSKLGKLKLPPQAI